MKGDIIQNVACPAMFKCTITEHKRRDADDVTAEHHIVMYTTPTHTPVPLELVDEDNGSIY